MSFFPVDAAQRGHLSTSRRSQLRELLRLHALQLPLSSSCLSVHVAIFGRRAPEHTGTSLTFHSIARVGSLIPWNAGRGKQYSAMMYSRLFTTFTSMNVHCPSTVAKAAGTGFDRIARLLWAVAAPTHMLASLFM